MVRVDQAALVVQEAAEAWVVVVDLDTQTARDAIIQVVAQVSVAVQVLEDL